jgi:integration host factor subunit alpha
MSARDLPTRSTVTRDDLIQRLITDGAKRSDAVRMVTVIVETLSEVLMTGEGLQIRSFGGFSVVNKRSRPVRNPRTGEPIVLSARRTVTFRPSAGLRARMTAKLCCAEWRQV